MGKIIKNRVEYGGSSNSAENIKYDDTKNVKEAIAEVKSEIAYVNSNFGQLIKIVGGTLPDTTGDYTMEYVIPDSYIPIKAYYLTDYNQWRDLNIGYFGTTLVIIGSTSYNVSRPYRLVCLKSD